MAYTTINKSTDYFNTKLYTGTGNSNAQTGIGFQPSLVWLKNRGASGNHHLIDAPRGITKELRANLGNTQADDNQLLTALGSDGFTVGTSGSGNTNGNTYVAWNWKANGQGSSNTNGSINTTYTSVDTTSGFSISTYTGTGSNATVGHGLGVVPQVMIVKNLTNANSWSVYHQDLNGGSSPQNYFLHLNETDPQASNAATWNNTAPTSSVFSIGTNNNTGGSYNYVAYCFAEKTGFSKFGSYIGNGNADGTFVYTGFKPAWILMKDIGRAESWYIYDGKILGYNGQMGDFLANTTASVGTNYAIQVDMLSNGFKLNTTASHLNGSGENFIYIAFAEAPLVGSNNIPATAR